MIETRVEKRGPGRIARRESEKRVVDAAAELAKADAALRRFELEQARAAEELARLQRLRAEAAKVLKAATEGMIADGSRTTTTALRVAS